VTTDTAGIGKRGVHRGDKAHLQDLRFGFPPTAGTIFFSSMGPLNGAAYAVLSA
jgi:hypothetical protein